MIIKGISFKFMINNRLLEFGHKALGNKTFGINFTVFVKIMLRVIFFIKIFTNNLKEKRRIQSLLGGFHVCKTEKRRSIAEF